MVVVVVVVDLLVPRRAAAAATITDCDPALAQSFTELLALELDPTRNPAEISLTCTAQQAELRVTRGGLTRGRTLALTTPDAARWLALAAAELARSLDEPIASPPEAQALAAPTARHTFALHADLRARLGDDPTTVRVGGQLGLRFEHASAWGLDASVRGTTRERSVDDGIRVRATELSFALTLEHRLRFGAFELAPGVGAVVGVARLEAIAASQALETSELWRGFAGPLASLCTALVLTPAWRIELALDTSYAVPRIEGRSDAGRVLFEQSSWASAAMLGVAYAL